MASVLVISALHHLKSAQTPARDFFSYPISLPHDVYLGVQSLPGFCPLHAVRADGIPVFRQSRWQLSEPPLSEEAAAVHLLLLITLFSFLSPALLAPLQLGPQLRGSELEPIGGR